MGAVIFLIFIILFVLFLFGLFSIAEGQRNPFARRTKPPSFQEQPRTYAAPRASAAAEGQAHDHHATRSNIAARRAMQRAGYDAGDAYVRLVDVGLLAYREIDEPKLIRYQDVSTDTEYLRPFVVLNVPYQARGMVRMEIVEHDGRLRYADETRYDLQQGNNTLLPGTWLPLRGEITAFDKWMLRVKIGDTLLAAHTFAWHQEGSELRQYIEADGEISPELKQAMSAQPSQALSLSQLLSQQDE